MKILNMKNLIQTIFSSNNHNNKNQLSTINFLSLLKEKGHITVNESDKIAPGFGNFGQMYYSINSFAHKEDLFPLQKIKFENFYFPVPNNPEAFLNMIYGKNYDKFPADAGTVKHLTKNEARMLYEN